MIETEDKNAVYQGVRVGDRQPVVLKLLASEHSSMQDLRKLQNHYAITKALNLPDIRGKIG
jgi:hypothetical protein